ncbi:hypothetical protein HYH03_019029 [Edaphochlamys debaryana]|uniref:Uncharacterized protein n=1 Tax=Edaphochlamys debaryana TaxID=47281 RepID=A0A836BMD8_9CHLO|nr:hypothetical protein HYH03_019029 [Edaphochlamys debaryana]|eukprot:KAG2482021.1 hypothetical protein HYH03_019029 [Edaphochlamys debaryana]
MADEDDDWGDVDIDAIIARAARPQEHPAGAATGVIPAIPCQPHHAYGAGQDARKDVGKPHGAVQPHVGPGAGNAAPFGMSAAGPASVSVNARPPLRAGPANNVQPSHPADAYPSSLGARNQMPSGHAPPHPQAHNARAHGPAALPGPQHGPQPVLAGAQDCQPPQVQGPPQPNHGNAAAQHPPGSLQRPYSEQPQPQPQPPPHVYRPQQPQQRPHMPGSGQPQGPAQGQQAGSNAPRQGPVQWQQPGSGLAAGQLSWQQGHTQPQGQGQHPWPPQGPPYGQQPGPHQGQGPQWQQQQQPLAPPQHYGPGGSGPQPHAVPPVQQASGYGQGHGHGLQHGRGQGRQGQPGPAPQALPSAPQGQPPPGQPCALPSGSTYQPGHGPQGVNPSCAQAQQERQGEPPRFAPGPAPPPQGPALPPLPHQQQWQQAPPPQAQAYAQEAAHHPAHWLNAPPHPPPQQPWDQRPQHAGPPAPHPPLAQPWGQQPQHAGPPPQGHVPPAQPHPGPPQQQWAPPQGPAPAGAGHALNPHGPGQPHAGNAAGGGTNVFGQFTCQGHGPSGPPQPPFPAQAQPHEQPPPVGHGPRQPPGHPLQQPQGGLGGQAGPPLYGHPLAPPQPQAGPVGAGAGRQANGHSLRPPAPPNVARPHGGPMAAGPGSGPGPGPSSTAQGPQGSNGVTSRPQVVTVTAWVELLDGGRFSIQASGFNQCLGDVLKAAGCPCYSRDVGWAFPAQRFSEITLKHLNDTALARKNLKLNWEHNLPDFVLKILRQSTQRTNREDLYEKVLDAAPPGQPSLASKLLAFQREGVRFALQRDGNALIADEPGLGKTLQACATMQCLFSLSSNKNKIAMIVCPASVQGSWAKELFTWLQLGESTVLETKRGADLVQSCSRYRVVITTYEHLVQCGKEKDSGEHKGMSFQPSIVVLDEAHYCKNDKAQRADAAKDVLYGAKHRLLLSGTPVVKQTTEIIPLLQGLFPEARINNNEFKERYARVDNRFGTVTGGKNEDELHRLLVSTVMIRRLKKDVLTISPKTRVELRLPLDEADADRLAHKMRELDGRKLMDKAKFKGKEFSPRGNPGIMELYGHTAVSKAPAAARFILHKLQTEDKVIVFAHHKEMINPIAAALRKARIDFMRIDGNVLTDKRTKEVERFQNDEGCRVALLSLKAANTGITLTAASTVIFAEMGWNPGDMQQAEDRAHRVGQSREVFCYYLLVKNSVDDLMWEILQRKSDTVGRVLDGASCNMRGHVREEAWGGANRPPPGGASSLGGGAPAGPTSSGGAGGGGSGGSKGQSPKLQRTIQDMFRLNAAKQAGSKSPPANGEGAGGGGAGAAQPCGGPAGAAGTGPVGEDGGGAGGASEAVVGAKRPRVEVAYIDDSDDEDVVEEDEADPDDDEGAPAAKRVQR